MCLFVLLTITLTIQQEIVGKIVNLITNTSRTSPVSPHVPRQPISRQIFTWTRLPSAALTSVCQLGMPTMRPDHANKHAPVIYSLTTLQAVALKSAHSSLTTTATIESATSLARIQVHFYLPKIKPEPAIRHARMEVTPIASTCVACRYALKFSMASWGLLQFVSTNALHLSTGTIRPRNVWKSVLTALSVTITLESAWRDAQQKHTPIAT